MQVYGAGSEDMDTLTFNAPVLLRHLTFSEAKKEPIMEINLEKALEGLEMDRSTVGPPAIYLRALADLPCSSSTSASCSGATTSSPSRVSARRRRSSSFASTAV
jgi:hypothetical protein